MEEGSHDELLTKNGVYASLVRKQLAKKASVLDQGKEKVGGTGGVGGRGGGTTITTCQNTQDAEADTIDKLLDSMQETKEGEGGGAEAK